VRKALLKTPIDGARLTSGFGNRMHPILGYSAFHKGVDFGAPAGTPIQAAGDGVVEQKGWNGGYGNYIRIRHGGEYATAYAHLSRFAAGVAEGARIRQGQIIGYVGSTGRSTGPHLHYEILRRGAQVNPVAVKFPTGRKLDGGDLTRFRAARVETDRLMAQTAPAPASNPPTLAAAR
jgi:murein DD-endopeptidase MepM/ murein hydrolase activator NlpD